MLPVTDFATLRMTDFHTVDVETLTAFTQDEDWGFDDQTWVGEAYQRQCFFLRPVAEPDALRLLMVDTNAWPDDVSEALLTRLGIPLVLNRTWAEVKDVLGKPPKRAVTVNDNKAAKWPLGDGAYDFYCEVSDDWGIMYFAVLACFDAHRIKVPT